MKIIHTIVTAALAASLPMLSMVADHDATTATPILASKAPWIISVGNIRIERIGAGTPTLVVAAPTECGWQKWESEMRSLAATRLVFAVTLKPNQAPCSATPSPARRS